MFNLYNYFLHQLRQLIASYRWHEWDI